MWPSSAYIYTVVAACPGEHTPKHILPTPSCLNIPKIKKSVNEVAAFWTSASNVCDSSLWEQLWDSITIMSVGLESMGGVIKQDVQTGTLARQVAAEVYICPLCLGSWSVQCVW